MESLRTIGSLPVSLAGLGCNNFGGRTDEDTSQAVVHAALDAGITHFDTADVYGDHASEEHLGRALGARRAEVIIGTKFGMRPPAGLTGGHPDWVARAAEASLRRLGTDWIDLYTLHTPDPETPIADTLGALDQLVTAGKVREIGCSNFSAAQLEAAAAVAKERGLRAFAAVQNQLNVIQRDQEEVLPTCRRLGIGFVPFSPLASGLLTGKYRRGEAAPAGTRLATATPDRRASLLSDEHFDQVDRLDTFARDHGHTISELALSWLAGHPEVVSVIAGATRPEQVHANVAATTAWSLTATERAEIDALLA